jgi:invasion protein IalB
MRTILLLAALLAALAAAPEAGAAPRFVGTFQDWNVYTVDNDNGRLCYAASEPKKEEGNYTRRGSPAVIVARLPIAPPNEQVSAQPGYSFKANTDAEVTIDNRAFRMFTRGEHAWASTAEDDAAIIEAMKKGAEMKVKGTSTRDTWSLDTYSLKGFTAAYNAMRDACG